MNSATNAGYFEILERSCRGQVSPAVRWVVSIYLPVNPFIQGMRLLYCLTFNLFLLLVLPVWSLNAFAYVSSGREAHNQWSNSFSPYTSHPTYQHTEVSFFPPSRLPLILTLSNASSTLLQSALGKASHSPCPALGFRTWNVKLPPS